MHEYLNYDKVIVTTTFAIANDFEISENGKELHLLMNVFSIATSEDLIRVFLKILSNHFKNCYLKRFFVENRFWCVEYIYQDEDERDEDIGDLMVSILDILRRKQHCVILPYLKGFRHLRIPADKAMDKIVDLSVATMLPRNKMVKMISPFVYDGKKLIDKRCQKLYDFVHECNGSSIDDIKADYERFVQKVMAQWNNK